MVKSKPIRLTTTSYALLALLEQLGESTSYDIKQALDKSIENFWPVPHTTAYEEPARLAEGGYLSVRQESGGRRRKSYSLTEEGREALRSWADEPSAAAPQLRDEFVLKVFAGADPEALVEERQQGVGGGREAGWVAFHDSGRIVRDEWFDQHATGEVQDA